MTTMPTINMQATNKPLEPVFPIPTIVEKTFHLKEGSALIYKLPVFSDSNNQDMLRNHSDTMSQIKSTQYVLIGGPIGAAINGTGYLHWNTQIDGNFYDNSGSQDTVEYLVVKVIGPCKQETALIEISVYVDRDAVTTTSSSSGTDPCSSDKKCMNGATCISRPDLEINYFTCICRLGFTGRFCEIELANVHDNDTRLLRDKDESFLNEDDKSNTKQMLSAMTKNSDAKHNWSSSNSSVGHSINRCLDEKLNPCFDKSLCRDTNTFGITCEACPQGYKGDGIRCISVHFIGPVQDPCLDSETNPCYPGADCRLVNGIVTCGPCPADRPYGNGKVCHSLQHSNDYGKEHNSFEYHPYHPRYTSMVGGIFQLERLTIMRNSVSM